MIQIYISKVGAFSLYTCMWYNILVNIKPVLIWAGKDEIHSPRYHLITGDLRNVQELNEKLLAAGVDQKWVYPDNDSSLWCDLVSPKSTWCIHRKAAVVKLVCRHSFHFHWLIFKYTILQIRDCYFHVIIKSKNCSSKISSILQELY